MEEIEYLTDGSWRPIRDEKEKDRERENNHTPEYPVVDICKISFVSEAAQKKSKKHLFGRPFCPNSNPSHMQVKGLMQTWPKFESLQSNHKSRTLITEPPLSYTYTVYVNFFSLCIPARLRVLGQAGTVGVLGWWWDLITC